MTTSKFKVGDRVVVVGQCAERGQCGAVQSVLPMEASHPGWGDFYVVALPSGLYRHGPVADFDHAPEAAGGPEDCPEGIVSFVDEVGGRVWMRQRPGTTQIRMGRIGQMGSGAFGHPEDTSDEHDVGAVIWVSTGVDLSRGDPW